MRVVRAQLDSGQRVIGVRFPEVLIAIAEKTAADDTGIRTQLVVDFVTYLLSFTAFTLLVGRQEEHPAGKT